MTRKSTKSKKTAPAAKATAAKTTVQVVDPVQAMIDHAKAVFGKHSGVLGVEVIINAVIPNPDGNGGLLKVEVLREDGDPKTFNQKQGKVGPSRGFHVSGKAQDPTKGDGEPYQVGVNIIKVRSNTWPPTTGG